MPFKQTARICATIAICGVAACEPMSDAERSYFESRDFDVEQERQLMQTMTEWNSVDGAIELVKSTPAPEDEEGTIEEWINRERMGIEGDVMFPRWEGLRRGSNRFEVRYTYTVIDFDYNIQKTGYRWDVDTMLKVVNGPEPIDPEELEPKPRRPLTQDAIEDELQEDFSLE